MIRAHFASLAISAVMMLPFAHTMAQAMTWVA